MKDWEIITDNLSKAGWTWRCISSTDHNGQQFWVAAPEREDPGRFIARADEKLTAFLELRIGDSRYSPARYATYRRAKAPSPIAIAVIALVGFIGPKKVSNPIANFSMAAATKTGPRIVGANALYTISAPTTKISTPQCRTKNTNELLGLSTPKPNRKNR